MGHDDVLKLTSLILPNAFFFFWTEELFWQSSTFVSFLFSVFLAGATSALTFFYSLNLLEFCLVWVICYWGSWGNIPVFAPLGCEFAGKTQLGSTTSRAQWVVCLRSLKFYFFWNQMYFLVHLWSEATSEKMNNNDYWKSFLEISSKLLSSWTCH